MFTYIYFCIFIYFINIFCWELRLRHEDAYLLFVTLLTYPRTPSLTHRHPPHPHTPSHTLLHTPSYTPPYIPSHPTHPPSLSFTPTESEVNRVERAMHQNRRERESRCAFIPVIIPPCAPSHLPCLAHIVIVFPPSQTSSPSPTYHFPTLSQHFDTLLHLFYTFLHPPPPPFKTPSSLECKYRKLGLLQDDAYGFGKMEEESPGVGGSGKRKAALPTLALRLDAYVKKGSNKQLLSGAHLFL